MAFDAFLKIEGIEGDSVAKGYEKWIEISSFSWGCVDEQSSGGGGGESQAMTTDLEFVTNFSKASPALLRGCTTGEHFQKATLQVRKAGGDRQGAFYKVTFADCLISSYQAGGSNDGFPTESVSINFIKADFDTGANPG